jgi:hypothetical protein
MMPQDASPQAPAAVPSQRPSLLGPVCIWLAVQMLGLLPAVVSAPLSARFVDPPERLALHEMLIVQACAAGLLFPILLPDLRCTLAIMLTTLPFAQAAGFLSIQPPMHVMAGTAFILIWLAALSPWAQVLAPGRRALLGVAAASVMTIGLPVLGYLHSEFGPAAGSSSAVQAVLTWGPVSGVLAQIAAPGSNLPAWGVACLIGSTGVCCRLVDGAHLRHRPTPAKPVCPAV